MRLGLALLCVLMAAPVLAEESPPEGPDRPWLGAAAQDAGSVALLAGGGFQFFAPYATLGVRVGMGAGTSVELRYEALMLVGQSGSLRLGWGTPVSEHWDIGLAAVSSISTLAAVNGLVGIEFQAFELGNDWLVGGEVVATWRRPGHAHLTFSVGAHGSLGGLRYSGFEARGFELDPGFHGVTGGVQGEWALGDDTNLVLRFDMMVPLGAEVIPLGYIPTGSGGVVWGW